MTKKLKFSISYGRELFELSEPNRKLELSSGVSLSFSSFDFIKGTKLISFDKLLYKVIKKANIIELLNTLGKNKMSILLMWNENHSL
jgi:hypothetical protein